MFPAFEGKGLSPLTQRKSRPQSGGPEHNPLGEVNPRQVTTVNTRVNVTPVRRALWQAGP